MTLLALRQLSRTYGGVTAVDRIDLTVSAGERVALIGPNGAGKTTLVDLVAGRQRPSAGEVRLDGTDITREAEHRRVRRGIAKTFQHSSLFDDLPVGENVALALRRRDGTATRVLRRADEAAHADEAAALLHTVGLGPIAARRAGTLSHGERRQAELCVTLATRPRLLLLDEPVAGMSPAETAAFVPLIKSLDPTLTVLIVEHDLDVVFAVAARVVVLAAGRVLADGAPATVREDAAVQEAYLGHRRPGSA